MDLLLRCLYFVLAAAFYKTALADTHGYVAYNSSSQCVAYKAQPACFGPRLPEEGLGGYLMEVTPPNACQPVESPPAPRKASEIYIALIQARDCSFFEKVLHAQEAGYQAAVVYDEGSERLVTMRADDRKPQKLIKIPSLFTGHSVSLHLHRILQCEKGAHIRILPPKHSLSPCQGKTKILQGTPIVQNFRSMFYVVIATISITIGLNWYQRAPKAEPHTPKQGDKYKPSMLSVAEHKERDHLKSLSCVCHGACTDTWVHTQPGKKISSSCKEPGSTHGQGGLRLEQAGEGVDEEEQDHEDNAFKERHEDGYFEEEKDDASILEWEGFAALESII